MFKIDKDEEEFAKEASDLLALNPYVNHNAAQLKEVLKQKGKN